MTYQALLALPAQFSLKLKEVCEAGGKDKNKLTQSVIDKLPFLFDAFLIKNRFRDINQVFSKQEEEYRAYLAAQTTQPSPEEQKTYEYLINYYQASILQVYARMLSERKHADKPLALQYLVKASSCVMDAYQSYDLMSEQVLDDWGYILHSNKNLVTDLFRQLLTRLIEQLSVDIEVYQKPAYEHDAATAKTCLKQAGLIYQELLRHRLVYGVYQEVKTAQEKCAALLTALSPSEQGVARRRKREEEIDKTESEEEGRPVLKKTCLRQSTAAQFGVSSSSGITLFASKPIDTPLAKAELLYQQANTSKTLEGWIEAAMAYEELSADNQSLIYLQRVAACYTEAIQISSPWYDVEGVFDKTWQRIAEAYKKLLDVSLTKENMDAFYNVIKLARKKEKLSAHYWAEIGDFFKNSFATTSDGRHLELAARCYREAAKKELTPLVRERLWQVSFDMFNQLTIDGWNKELVPFRVDCLYNQAKNKVDQTDAADMWVSAAEAYEILFEEDGRRNNAYLKRFAECYQKAAQINSLSFSHPWKKKAANAYRELATREVERADSEKGAHFCDAQCQIIPIHRSIGMRR